MSNEFNLEDEAKEEVEMKLRSLLESCQIYRIPMFASVVIENTETDTKYNNIVYGATSHKIDLTDDKIEKYILIANGFNAVPPRDSVDMFMDSISIDMPKVEEDINA